MIEPTDEMVEAFISFGVDEAEFLLADIRAGLAAVLAIVERDYRVTPRRREHYGRASVTDERLREVAAVYRSSGQTPQRAVAEHLGCAHRTAGWWIRRARDAGFLGEAVGPKAGEQP